MDTGTHREILLSVFQVQKIYRQGSAHKCESSEVRRVKSQTVLCAARSGVRSIFFTMFATHENFTTPHAFRVGSNGVLPRSNVQENLCDNADRQPDQLSCGAAAFLNAASLCSLNDMCDTSQLKALVTADADGETVNTLSFRSDSFLASDVSDEIRNSAVAVHSDAYSCYSSQSFFPTKKVVLHENVLLADVKVRERFENLLLQVRMLSDLRLKRT